MIDTSAQYKLDMLEPFAPFPNVLIEMEVVEPDVANDGTYSSNVTISDRSTFYSYPEGIEVNGITDKFGTFETGRWWTDGSTRAIDIPPFPYPESSILLESMSDVNGEFTTNPYFQRDYTATYDIAGLTLYFDSRRGQYPSEIRIIAYLGASEVFNTIYNPTDSYFETLDAINGFNKLRIEFVEMDTPYTRPRIERIIYGTILSYDNSTLIGCELDRYIDPSGAFLPKYEFKFTVNNIDGLFDVDNPDGIYAFILAKQIVTAKAKYILSDFSVEEFGVAGVVTTGVVTTTDLTATIFCEGRISSLSKIFKKGLVVTAPISLGSLVVQLQNDTDEDYDYVMDSDLNSIYTLAPLPILPIKECYQLIAAMAGLLLYDDIEGNITIGDPDDTQYTLDIDFNTQYNKPVIESKSQLRNMIVNVYDYIKESSASTLAVVSIEDSGVLYIAHAMADDISSAVTSGTGTITNTDDYAEYTEVTVSGTGTTEVTLTGKLVNKVISTVSVVANTEGVDCIYDNPLITDTANGLTVANNLIDWYNKRNVYTSDYRGRYELEANDLIYAETAFTENMSARVVGNKMVHGSGGTKGTVVWRDNDV